MKEKIKQRLKVIGFSILYSFSVFLVLFAGSIVLAILDGWNWDRAFGTRFVLEILAGLNGLQTGVVLVFVTILSLVRGQFRLNKRAVLCPVLIGVLNVCTWTLIVRIVSVWAILLPLIWTLVACVPMLITRRSKHHV